MQRNAEMQKYAEKCKECREMYRNEEKYWEMQRNADMQRYPMTFNYDLHDTRECNI